MTTSDRPTDRPDDPADSPAVRTVESGPDTEDIQQEREPKAGSRKSELLRAGVLVFVTLLVVAVGILGWLLADARSELAAEEDLARDAAQAEQVALDYAIGAAEMDHQDLPAWHQRLTANTTPELTERLKRAAESMEQIIVPLQWVSSATPIAAKAEVDEQGVYSVNAFVSVLTRNSQAPEGISSTATYQLRIDPEGDWTIVDVSDFSEALAPDEPR